MARLLFNFMVLLSLTTIGIFAQIPERVGWWDFNDTTNLTRAVNGYGFPLELVGIHQPVTGAATGDYATRIGVGSYYVMRHRIAPNGGGNRVNEYTLLIDFKVPSLSVWHCFFQTVISNNNDGDCFINPNGNIGVAATGYSVYKINQNEWYRLVLSVKNGTQYRYFLDGQIMNSGTVQAVDGRFSLDTLLLMFADEDGEDNEMIVSEISIWDKALTPTQIQNLGGFGHNIGTLPGTQLILYPYLQMPSPNSVWVNWHDTLAGNTSVDYGSDSSLGITSYGTSEIIAGNYRWHSAKLTNLEPDKEYFYKIKSGSGESNIFSFRTLPGNNFHGKLRFLLLSDTHNNDTSWAVKVIKNAKRKIQEIWGPDIHNHLTLVLHSGDLVQSGSTVEQYTDQYFAPMMPLSANVPVMTISGNHELEHQNYYSYMKYDEASPVSSFNEKFWQLRVANTIIVGLNSNAVSSIGLVQKNWLDEFLNSVENDTSIDFVIMLTHHFSVTELWGEGMTYDDGPAWVTNSLYPVLRKYSKVVQHSYGHTHGYERGTIETIDPDGRGDIRIVCGGGGGGATDRWGACINKDFPQIHITLDHYFYQLIEIDAGNKTYETFIYSLGNSSRTRNNELMDRWYRKSGQEGPNAPLTYSPVPIGNYFIFNSSPCSGADSLMSVRLQASSDTLFSSVVVDTIINWKNIFGVDTQFEPIDRNAGIDLTKISIQANRFAGSNLYFYRVKYRDHNTKWSDWSNVTSFNGPLKVVDSDNIQDRYFLRNYPNPFGRINGSDNFNTQIFFGVGEKCRVRLSVYGVLGEEIEVLVNDELEPNSYNITFDGSSLPSGVYLLKMVTGDIIRISKILLIK